MSCRAYIVAGVFNVQHVGLSQLILLFSHFQDDRLGAVFGVGGVCVELARRRAVGWLSVGGSRTVTVE